MDGMGMETSSLKYVKNHAYTQKINMCTQKGPFSMDMSSSNHLTGDVSSGVHLQKTKLHLENAMLAYHEG